MLAATQCARLWNQDRWLSGDSCPNSSILFLSNKVTFIFGIVSRQNFVSVQIQAAKAVVGIARYAINLAHGKVFSLGLFTCFSASSRSRYNFSLEMCRIHDAQGFPDQIETWLSVELSKRLTREVFIGKDFQVDVFRHTAY